MFYCAGPRGNRRTGKKERKKGRKKERKEERKKERKKESQEQQQFVGKKRLKSTVHLAIELDCSNVMLLKWPFQGVNYVFIKHDKLIFYKSLPLKSF